VDRLLEIEEANFPGDRISRRSFRYYLQRQAAGRARLLVDCGEGTIRGAALLTALGRRTVRLYSLVVDAPYRRGGIAGRLMDAAERWAVRTGYARLVLEVRVDNAGAIRFYEARGYRVVAEIDDYYEDGCRARRYAKPLRSALPRAVRRSRTATGGIRSAR
jgi:ribosomal protein S18 acetylase RimI-like enzyme